MISSGESNLQLTEDYKLSKRLEFSFIKSFRSILTHLTEEEINENNKSLIKSFTEGLKEMKNDLESRSGGKDTLIEILTTIKYALIESVYIRDSLFLRFILKNVFNIEYMCSDSELIDSIIDQPAMPHVFAKENYYDSKMTLKEICDFPLQMKKLGDLFEFYTTSYPFERKQAIEELKLLVNANGRLLVYENFFLWFSGYIAYYKKTLEDLMNEEGIIPITWRYYIAIMAVSTVRSYYLLNNLQQSFLCKGGDEDWLIYGLERTPEKLQKLSRINNILAHQPWKITTEEINELLVNNKAGWTRGELVHASLILVNFHRLAAIIESLKFSVNENFLPSQNLKNKNDQNNPNLNDQIKTNRDGKTVLYNNLVELNEEEENTEEKEKKDHRKLVPDDLEIDYNNFSSENNLSALFNKHTSNFCTLYLDFDVYSDIPLSNMNFSWENEGYYILENIYHKGNDSLNNEIKFLSELTSYTIGGGYKKLDTFHFRNSIKCYIEKIFGFVNEDYDYAITNKLIPQPTKAFMKKIACVPQKISKSDIQGNFENTFSDEEIFHLILVSSIAKTRVQLTFLSHKIYDIIKSID